MAKTYTAETLPASALNGFRKETQGLIRIALQAGWTLHEATRGNVTLKGFDPRGVIHLSKASRNNSGPLQQLTRKVQKYGDPLKVAALVGYGVTGNVELTQHENRERGYVPDLPSFRSMMGDIPPDQSIILRSIPNADLESILAEMESADLKYDTFNDLVEAIVTVYAQRKRFQKEDEQLTAGVEEAAEVVAKKKPERHIVSAHPYMSHKSKGSEKRPGRSYESKSIIEQRWSDGSVNYKCTLCPHESDYAVGITSHWKKHTNAGEVPLFDQSTVTLVDDPNYTEHAYTKNTNGRAPIEPDDEDNYTPREDRVEALKVELLAALKQMQGEDLDHMAEVLAFRSLRWVHAQHGNGVPREPQTAEEVLEAIRALVDRGEYARMRQAALDAEATADAALERAERAEAQRDKVRRDVVTLKELLASVGGDDDDE